MVYNPNANWTARTNAAAKEPVYAVRFDALQATTLYATAPVRSATSTIKQYLKNATSIAQRLSQTTGRQSMTLFDFDLVDRDNEITSLVHGNSMVNQKVTILSGYADLVEADYAPVGVGQINGVRLLDDRVTYRFQLSDFKRHQSDRLFLNAEAGQQRVETKLAGDVAAGAASIQVLQVTNMKVLEFLFLGPSTDAGFLGQEEKIQINYIDATASPPKVFLRTPLAKAFKTGDEVRWATTVIEGNPINLLYALLTGDFSSATFPLLVKKGLPTGLGVAAADVDSAVLQAERDDFQGDEVWRFEEKAPQRAFTFLEQRFYLLLGYARVSAAGKLSLRIYGPPRAAAAAAGLPQITEDHILSWEAGRDHGLHINSAILGLDHDAADNSVSNLVTVEDTADQSSTKETQEIEQRFTGLREAKRGVRLAEERGQAMIRRFLKPPFKIDAPVSMTKRALEVGDVAEVTHAAIPNPRTGARGLTKFRMEIVERAERFSSGVVDLVLQDAGFERPAFIAPDAAPDYGAASAADKEYAYIAPDAGNFADGGKPYEIV